MIALRVFWLVLVCCLGLRTLDAAPAQVILLRHAEKPLDPSDPHLTPQGEERARALASFLSTNQVLLSNGPPAALFAARPSRHEHGRRAYDTVAPLAERLGMVVQVPYQASDYAALASILRNDPHYEGRTVIVCWIHTFLPDLARELGVKKVPKWKPTTFDRLWVITYPKGRAKLAILPQKLLPGDSCSDQ